MIGHVKKSNLRQIIPEDSNLEICISAISTLENALQNDEVMSLVRSTESGVSVEETMKDQLKRFKSRKEKLEREQRNSYIH